MWQHVRLVKDLGSVHANSPNIAFLECTNRFTSLVETYMHNDIMLNMAARLSMDDNCC